MWEHAGNLYLPKRHGLTADKSGKVTSGRFSNLSGVPELTPVVDPKAKNDGPFFMLMAGGLLIVWLVAAGELSL